MPILKKLKKSLKYILINTKLWEMKAVKLTKRLKCPKKKFFWCDYEVSKIPVGEDREIFHIY